MTEYLSKELVAQLDGVRLREMIEERKRDLGRMTSRDITAFLMAERAAFLRSKQQPENPRD